MTTIEELQKMTLAAGDEISHVDVTSRIPEVWGNEIEKRAEVLRIFRNYVQVNTDLVGKPGSTIKLPKRGYIDYNTYPATDIADDLTDVPINTELTFETVTIEPSEVGIASSITQQAIDEVMISLMENVKEQLAGGIALKEDKDIVTALVAPAASGLVYVEAGAAGATAFVSGDWTAAQAALDQVNITATDVISLPVVAEAMTIMEINGFEADTLFIHPRQKASFLKDDLFIDASQAGQTDTRVRGFMTNLYGLEVLVSKNVPTIAIETDGSGTGYQAIMIDRSAAGAIAVKRPVTIETEYKPQQRRHYIYATTMYKAARLNEGAVVLINTGIGA